jgi:hypothetical protein
VEFRKWYKIGGAGGSGIVIVKEENSNYTSHQEFGHFQNNII